MNNLFKYPLNLISCLYLQCRGVRILLTPSYTTSQHIPLPDWPPLWSNRSHRQTTCGPRPPQFSVAQGHNNFKVTERLFAAGGRYSSLCPKATIWFQNCPIGHFCGQINVTNVSFAASGCHSSLWTKATTFEYLYQWDNLIMLTVVQQP